MNRPVRADFLISGIERARIFAALLDVERFPEWSVGLHRVRILGNSPPGIEPGTVLEFTLSAAGLTHEVAGEVTTVEAPSRISWRYTSGAVGGGGWLLEEEGTNAVRVTLATDYQIEPAWLNRLAHRPFFRGIAEDLLRRSLRRLEHHLRAAEG